MDTSSWIEIVFGLTKSEFKTQNTWWAIQVATIGALALVTALLMALWMPKVRLENPV